MADGSPLPDDPGSCAWQWQPDQGNDGAFESRSPEGATRSTLMVLADGLKPGATYEVFGCFWADASGHSDSAPRKLHPVHWGLTLASLHPFDGRRPDRLVSKEPSVITPGYLTGQAYGYQATVEAEAPLEGLAKLDARRGSSRLIRARLGYSRAGSDGSLPVFFADFATNRTSGHGLIDGIVLRPADSDARIEPGWKPGTRLHLAIRAGDPVTIRREIEAGADVNAFDEERLTPLFYAAACGHAKLVRELLQHAAKPDQPGQSVSPLVAAASISNVEITRLLLDAGAEVPLTSPEDRGALVIEIDPRFLHPVVAAIRAGSVPVLKLLLEQQPTLRIESLVTDLARINIERMRTPRIPDPYLVANAIVKQNWEMAAFLIDRGCYIPGWGVSHYKNPDATMMARAVAAGNEAMPVVEAMLRRRISPVFDGRGGYFPGDGLTAAAWSGNATLFKRFIPFAREVSPFYQNQLLQYALYAENPEIIAIIHRRFPDAVLSRGKPETAEQSGKQLGEGSARLFLPRTTPPARSTSPPGSSGHVLAVIASPEASAAGDLLSVLASDSDGWTVVDREMIEAALTEGAFRKPWLDGEHRLSDLGDRLTADCLVIVSAIQAGKEVIHRFEVVEVATGLEVHREHIKGTAFTGDKEMTGFLGRAGRALDAAGRNERHQAITLLSFSAQGKIDNPSAVSSLLRASLQHEVDATPGLISLSRAQSSRLVEEQALQGKDSVWGAAHMIEGVISPNGAGGIKVALRLETLGNGTSTMTDAQALGTAESIPETAAEAWKKLLETAQGPSMAPAPEADARGNALPEGRRLMREAEWLHSLDADPASYLPLIESAVALGVPPEETITLHLDGFFRQFTPLGWRRSWLTDGSPTTKLQDLAEVFNHLPHSLAVSDRLAFLLPMARQFLHQTSWYLDRGGRDYFEGAIDDEHLFETYKGNEIWYAIQALCYIRSAIYRKQVPEDFQAEFQLFGTELDALTRRYFALLKDVFDPDPNRYFMQLTDAHLYRRNPELANGMVEMATTGAPLTRLMRRSPYTSHGTGSGMDHNLHGWMEPRKHLARRMIEEIGDSPSPYLKFKKADLECFVAASEDRPQALRRLLAATAEVFADSDPYDGQVDYNLISQGIMDTGTTSYLFNRYPSGCSLAHGGSMLPSLLSSPRPAPDILIRQRSYLKALNALRRGSYQDGGKDNPTVRSFREKMASNDPDEIERLEKRGFRKRKSRGPTRISTLPPARNLHSLVYGSGKRKDGPDNPAAEKPESTTLTAALLTDLRKGSSPGIAIWPLVDNTDSSRLWIFYFPSVGDRVRVNLPGNGAQSHGLDYKAPWLLSIDCRDGSIGQEIDLHAAVGSAYGKDLSGRTCAIWDMAFDQTRSRILTNVGWSHESWATNKMGSVVIDKATGKSRPLPGNPVISEGKAHKFKELWDLRVGVVGVGEHFFYLGRGSETNGGVIDGLKTSARSIFQIDPDLSVTPLTVIGRRPDLTPFDAIDRAPMAITLDQGRLFVANPSTLAHYAPKTGEWSIIDSTPSENPLKETITPLVDAHLDTFLRSIHEIHLDGKATGWTAVGWNHAAGVMPFTSKNQGARKIFLKAEIPEDFLNTTFAIQRMPDDKDGKPVFEQVPLKDHPKFKTPDMVVLAQTDNDLILGMQTSRYYEWKRPSRNAPHLPFLWKISKAGIMEALAGD